MNTQVSDKLMTGDYPNRGPVVFAVTTGTLVLATVFVAARLTCRIFIVRQVTWDDYFILLAWALAFGLSFAIDFGTSVGLGLHDADITAQDWGPLRRAEYTFTVLYVRHTLNPAYEHFA
ncbi:hypothetical protein ONZ43_g3101 [Nemania bipapillata]|uniref:Uncharacterized protein n=1 Tax=Nemania bipapillata TaxID=110536 RepID=A0ACC2IY02_9PEZI|nr:hypothetical protein ONZ43_g3101 [Nemania bipapillata]